MDRVFVETRHGEVDVSVNAINKVSEYLIAKVDTENDLGDLAVTQQKEQEARTEALKLAYKEVPIPSGQIPIHIRIAMAEKRNELAEKYYEEIIKRKR